MVSKEEKRKQNALRIFDMIKKRENLVVTNKATHFSETDIRIMSELYLAKRENRNIISSQIARRVGLTRAAVSQIVKKLEKEGMVERTPANNDKKSEFVHLTKLATDAYRRDEAVVTEFIGATVETFGEDKFETLYELYTQFIDLVQQRIKESKKC